uniref:Xylulose kinase-1 n=1 Tax=Tanacetum cinerariifolium TaxID=118510 RepID=A0A699HYP1_TANCI|nr:hypothetical protein [Tanacetum cinerariifolium]
MVAYLTKFDASEGFNQVIDFLNGSYIKYALIMNPNIYLSCIKQFWNTVVIKQFNDVTRLQALVDKKKVVVTEAAIREVLRLDDAEGVDCLTNEEIFAELARMGYEKPSTKLTFYKAFFSSQWNSAMASAVICLSTGRKFNFSKYIFDCLVRNVDITTKFYMYPHFLQLLIRKQVGDLSTYTTKYVSPTLTQKVFANMRRVGKGFSRVDTPLFEGMLVGQEIEEEGDEEEHVEDVTAGDDAQGDDIATHGEVPTVSQEPSIPSYSTYSTNTTTSRSPINIPALDACVVLTRRVEHLEYDKVAQALEITKLKRRRIDTSDDTVMDDESNQERIIDEMDKDNIVALMDDKEDDKKDDKEEDKKDEEAKVVKNDQVQGRQAESQAKIYIINMDHASKVLSMLEDKPTEVQEVVDVVTTAKLITEVVIAASKTVTAASAIISAAEPQVPAAPTRVLDYFKGMSYNDIGPIFEAEFNSNIEFLLKTKDQMKEEENRALQSINETSAQKAAKKRKLNEEVEDHKRHLEIVPNEDDDV